MKRKHIVVAVLLGCLGFGGALAKLPPLGEEARAKAEEAKAKAAHGDKVAAYQLCKSQEKVAERYLKERKGTKPAPSTCQDPGPFQMASTAPAAAAVPASAPAAAPAPAKKQ